MSAGECTSTPTFDGAAFPLDDRSASGDDRNANGRAAGAYAVRVDSHGDAGA